MRRSGGWRRPSSTRSASRGAGSPRGRRGVGGNGHRPARDGLADLIEYRRLVEEVPEWPLDPGVRARFLLYVALPLGSWLGGALVERLIDAALG